MTSPRETPQQEAERLLFSQPRFNSIVAVSLLDAQITARREAEADRDRFHELNEHHKEMFLHKNLELGDMRARLRRIEQAADGMRDAATCQQPGIFFPCRETLRDTPTKWCEPCKAIAIYDASKEQRA